MTHTRTDAPIDVVHVNTEAHLNWGDRFRVLVGRPIHVNTQISIWNGHISDDARLVTEVKSSQTWVESFIRHRRKGGYAMSPTHAAEAGGDGMTTEQIEWPDCQCEHARASHDDAGRCTEPIMANDSRVLECCDCEQYIDPTETETPSGASAD